MLPHELLNGSQQALTPYQVFGASLHTWNCRIKERSRGKRGLKLRVKGFLLHTRRIDLLYEQAKLSRILAKKSTELLAVVGIRQRLPLLPANHGSHIGTDCLSDFR